MKHSAYITLIALLSVCTILTFSEDKSVQPEVRIKSGDPVQTVSITPAEDTLASCQDGIDNDGNGLIDTDDKLCISLAYVPENEVLRPAVLASAGYSNWNSFLESKKSQNKIPRITVPRLASN